MVIVMVVLPLPTGIIMVMMMTATMMIIVEQQQCAPFLRRGQSAASAGLLHSVA